MEIMSVNTHFFAWIGRELPNENHPDRQLAIKAGLEDYYHECTGKVFIGKELYSTSDNFDEELIYLLEEEEEILNGFMEKWIRTFPSIKPNFYFFKDAW